MTDSENQRQRHLAEMMIAQCEGKTIQWLYGEKWTDTVVDLYTYAMAQLRIKPEPREWWICETCNGRIPAGSRCHCKNSKDGFLKCDGQLIHVREVTSE